MTYRCIVAPRPDGVFIALGPDERLHPMGAEEMLALGARFVDAGIEALRSERGAQSCENGRLLCDAEQKSASAIASTSTLNDSARVIGADHAGS